MENNRTVVVNRHKETFDVYCGRGTPFGNPFIVGRDGTRQHVINRYKEYFDKKILFDPEFKRKVLELKGKRLACSCAPLLCHLDIIAAYINGD